MFHKAQRQKGNDMVTKVSTIKKLAKAYGKAIRNDNVRVDTDFLKQIEQIVDAVVFYSVLYQDDKSRKTLTKTDWGVKTLEKGISLKDKHNCQSLYHEVI